MAKDEAKAAKWFRKAAQQEHAESQHCLGLLCLDGVGVQQDTAAAAVWFQKAVRPRPPRAPRRSPGSAQRARIVPGQGQEPPALAPALTVARKAAAGGSSMPCSATAAPGGPGPNRPCALPRRQGSGCQPLR